MKTFRGMQLMVTAGVVSTAMMAASRTASADPAVYRQALDGTVWILAPQSEESTSMGTGVLIDKQQQLVVTAAHVVGEAGQTLVFFPFRSNDGRVVGDPNFYLRRSEALVIGGEVIARDTRRDLALLRLTAVPQQARAIPLAVDTPEPGETIHLIGNSGSGVGALWRYATGTVRQSYILNTNFGTFDIEARVVETQVPANSGDSGGPMLNSRGELVATVVGGSSSQNNVQWGTDVAELRPLLARHAPGATAPQPPAAQPPAAQPPAAQPPARQAPVRQTPPPINPNLVSRTLIGHSWACRYPASGTNGGKLFWVTTFRPDGRFVEVVLDEKGKTRQRTDGSYTIGRNQLTMTLDSGQLHWTGVIIVHDSSTVTYRAAGEDDLHAVRLEKPLQAQRTRPRVERASQGPSLSSHPSPRLPRTGSRWCR